MVIAMAYAQLGRHDEAAQLVADAQSIVDERFKAPLEPWEPAPQILWFDWINARLLVREAAALLDQRDKPSAPKPLSPGL
jgi:hypothetical protein